MPDPFAQPLLDGPDKNPCGVCGSLRWVWGEPTEGGWCPDCGSSDADE